MEIHELLRVLTRRWWIIGATILAGFAIAFTASVTAAPTYVASTSVYMTTRTSGSIYSLFISSLYAKHSVNTFSDVARSSIVLRPVIDELHLPYSVTQLADRVSVKDSALEPQFIRITVEDTQGPRSAAIANAVAQHLSAATARLTSGAATAPVVTLSPTAPAVAPAHAMFPRTPVDIGVGIIAGLLAGLVLGRAVERLDSRIRRAEDVEDVPVLVAIPRDPASREPLVTAAVPSDDRTEVFRRLALTVQRVDTDGASRVLVVAAASEAVGRPAVTADLALATATALSDRSGRVLLVAADLRHRGLDRLLGMEDARGLSDLLAGTAPLDDLIRPRGTFDVLPAGALPPNALTLLHSDRLPALLHELRGRYDVVLLDAPPLQVSDAALLGSLADATVLVVEAGRTTTAELRASVDRVVEGGGRPFGVVLDGIAVQDRATAYASAAQPAPVGGVR